MLYIIFSFKLAIPIPVAGGIIDNGMRVQMRARRNCEGLVNPAVGYAEGYAEGCAEQRDPQRAMPRVT